jgi:7-carboxy-7-deazaguanine synthase
MAAPSTYLIKEIFGPTIQGEGTHAGRPCVFLRFAVCNLRCTWCDTDFDAEGATRMSAEDIVRRLRDLDIHGARMVVVTGGEPTLQWDAPLAAALRAAGFTVHMESNGTHALKAPVDWLTVSPKIQFHRRQDSLLAAGAVPASECKVVVDDTVSEDTLAAFERHYTCERWSLQPCMDERYQHHLARAIELVTRRPRWHLSLQLHKIVGLP